MFPFVLFGVKEGGFFGCMLRDSLFHFKYLSQVLKLQHMESYFTISL